VDERTIPRILNNEVVLLVALSVFAFGVFVFTKRMATIEARSETRMAAIWYEQGEQAAKSGNSEKAIEAFRKATTDAPDNKNYTLALARGLASGNRDAEARQLLLQLRESDPENAEVNIYLARLAATQGSVQEAAHYYENALYGRWTGDQVDVQRLQLRTEFVRFLLQHNERALASSELLILEGEVPNSAPARTELAKLFLQASDLQYALKNYTEAIRLDSQNVEALTGAGATSFQMGNYSKAAHYLKAALDLDPAVQQTRDLLALAQQVLAADPLAPNLGPQERQSRLLADVEVSSQRLDGCLSQTLGDRADAEMQSLKAELVAMQPTLNSRKPPPDFDAVRSAVGLLFRIQKAASDHCGAPPVEDQAILLVGRAHSGDQP
jgi:tetratricopeptide (TPR) repeat protein